MCGSFPRPLPGNILANQSDHLNLDLTAEFVTFWVSNVANVDFIDETRETFSASDVKYCRSCWRPEVHRPIPISPFLLGFLTVMTLGLIFWIRPTRCVCCGKTKVI